MVDGHGCYDAVGALVWSTLNRPNQATHLPTLSVSQMRVPRSQRGGEIVEPLVREQWFVRMEPLAKPALEVGRLGC